MNKNSTPFEKRNNQFAGKIVTTDDEPEVKKSLPIKHNDNNREKYTATMDKELRIRIKVASANLGVQVSSFIEDACLEKLNKEGY